VSAIRSSAAGAETTAGSERRKAARLVIRLANNSAAPEAQASRLGGDGGREESEPVHQPLLTQHLLVEMVNHRLDQPLGLTLHSDGARVEIIGINRAARRQLRVVFKVFRQQLAAFRCRFG